ncbi:MAG: hypothetical protein HRU03_09220, partial [Nanoarchaeales archaeon]|nr:hypothetical protein [Nanoarchaeales archaeon]
MSTVFDDNSSSLKLEKLNLYWNKYGFLRKRIYYDILFLFKKFESDENINFLIINSFNEKTGTGKLLKLIKIIELLNNKKIIKITRG